jgi:hypothetical protein
MPGDMVARALPGLGRLEKGWGAFGIDCMNPRGQLL